MLRRLVTPLLAGLMLILLAPATAAADEQGSETLQGHITDPEPVEGIEITAFDNGDEIATATTDADGEWEIGLPGPGTYRVVLNEDTVPDELAGFDIVPGAEHDDVDVREGQERGVIFRFADPAEDEEESEPSPDDEGEGEAADDEAADADEGTVVPEVEAGASFTDRFFQVATNGLVFGLVIAISGVGLSLIFGTTRMINFAHGDMVTFGALMALLFSTGVAGLGNAVLGIVLSAVVAIGIGLLLRDLLAAQVRLIIQGAVLVVGIVGSTLVSVRGGDALEWRVTLAGSPGLGNGGADVAAIVAAPVLIGAIVLGAGLLLRDRLPGSVVLVLQGVLAVLGVAAGLWLGVIGAVVVAVILGAALGAGMERYVWQPLRVRNVALIQMFIVSIGIALLLRHALLVLFGGSRASYPEYQIQDLLRLGPIAITPRSLGIMLISIVVLVAVACMLQFTRIGKAMRAVADNRDLAESSGIDVARVTLYVWTLGGGLAALGGVMAGLNQILHWQMGFHLLLLMFAAVILGGLGTAYGAMLGGVVIGMVAMLSTLWFPHQLMQAWALAIMIIMLLVRPQGLLGRRERIG